MQNSLRPIGLKRSRIIEDRPQDGQCRASRSSRTYPQSYARGGRPQRSIASFALNIGRSVTEGPAWNPCGSRAPQMLWVHRKTRKCWPRSIALRNRAALRTHAEYSVVYGQEPRAPTKKVGFWGTGLRFFYSSNPGTSGTPAIPADPVRALRRECRHYLLAGRGRDSLATE